MQRSRTWRLLALAAGLTALTGCANEVEDVDRVQPHYTEKSALDGEWYFRQTVVDHPPELAYLFTGIEGGLKKVRWEIREHELVAFQVHESVVGIDANETKPGADYVGDPVALFAITGHFDIIRDFNRQTGEQSNVLVEDTSLKPWYERQYMRVDWSSNNLYDATNIGLYFDGTRITHTNSYWVRETEKWNPHHLQQTEDLVMFTTRYGIGDGGLTCYFFYGLPLADLDPACGTVDVLVRSAFVKIDPEEVEQFEPAGYLDRSLLRSDAEPFTDADGDGRYDGPEHFDDTNGNGRYDNGEDFTDRNGNGEWDDAEEFSDTNGNGRWDDVQNLRYTTVSVGDDADVMVDVACTPEVLDALAPEVTLEDCRDLQWEHHGRFGYFRTERTAYDRRVGGGHDANRNFYANHHQMWKRTQDDQGRRIPKSERELRPIVYYLNPNFPENLKETAGQISDDWDDAFMDAAMAATGRDASAIGEQLARDYDDPLAVYLSNEKGEKLDNRALFQVRDNTCSAEGIARYLMLAPEMVDIFNEGTDGGLSADELSSDVGDDAAVASAVDAVKRSLLPGNLEKTCSGLTWYSRQRGLDTEFVWQQMGDPRFSYVWWVNEAQATGPLGYGPSSPDPETGQIISGNAYVYGASVDTYARSAADVVRFMNGTLCDGEAGDDFACLRDGRSYFDWVEQGSTFTGADFEITPEFQQEISRRIGSNRMEGYRSFETDKGVDKAAMMRHMRDRIARPSDSDPLAAATDGPLDEGRARIEALKQNPSFRAKMVTEETLQLLGPLFGWRPGDEVPEAMHDLALEISVDPNAVQRHMRERERFWAEHNVYLPEAMDDSVIGQALELKDRDPEEVYQILRKEIFRAVMLHEIGHTVGLRHNFQASFDALNYHEEFWDIRTRFDDPLDWKEQRLPEFRYASIMDYGARFNSDTKGLGKYDHAAIKYVYGGQGEVFGEGVRVPGRLDLELQFKDYSRIPDLLGGDTGNIYDREHRSVEELMLEKREGVLTNAKLFAANPDRPASDFWVDRTVPYMYCDDGYRGDIKCRTWDEGSNHTEAVESAIQRYWEYYFFNSYRRKRDESAFLNGFFGRQGRLSEYLNYPWKFYYFYDAYPVDTREDLLRASLLGMNFINQVLGTPEPGRYCREGAFFIPAAWRSFDTQRACESINIPRGQGRDLYLDFSDDYDYRLDYIGLYYDKINFFFNLLDTRSGFYRVTDFTDSRRFNIGYYLAFKDDTVDLLRDMMYSALGFITRGSRFNSYIDYDFDPRTGDAQLKLQPQMFIDPSRAGDPAGECGNGAIEYGEECDDGNDDDLDGCLSSCNKPRIFSRIPYNLAWQGIALSTIYNTTSADRLTDFVEYIHISEVGSGDDRTITELIPEVMGFCSDDQGQECRSGLECGSGVCSDYEPASEGGVPVSVFTHPMTGRTYKAAMTADGRSLGFELLELANAFVANDWEPVRAELERNPNDEGLQAQFEDVDFQLQNYVEFMDDLRELKSWVDWAR